MQVFEYKLENFTDFNDDVVSLGVSLDDVLYFDIETTGLSRDKNQIYLIGVGYYSAEGCDLNIIQWFAEDVSQEADIIRAFSDFLSSYSAFINFNGRSFDTPFIMARAKKHGISLNLDEFKNIDLYTYVKPFKKLLGLNDLKQKTLEQFLKVKRDDLYSGGELIEVYKNYCKNFRAISSQSTGSEISDKLTEENKKNLNMLLLHNMEDVKNMHNLLPLIKLERLNDLQISYVNHTVCEYKGYNKLSYELVVKCSHNLNLDMKFTSIVNIDSGTYALNYSKDRLCIRIPVKCDTLGYYFENYKDYYYLPNEDMCVLKSVAEGVAKENRENATKENCRVTLNGKFIYAFLNHAAIPPNSSNNRQETDIHDSALSQDNMRADLLSQIKKFKTAHNSKFEYIRLDDFEALPAPAKTQYLTAVVGCFI